MTRMGRTLNSFKTVVELIRFELIQAVAQRRILAVISLYFLVIAALSWSWLWFNNFVEEEWAKRNIESEGLTGELLLDMVKDQLFERFVGFVGEDIPGGIATLYQEHPIAFLLMLGVTIFLPALVVTATFDHGLENIQNRVFHFYALRVTRNEWFLAHYISALILTFIPATLGIFTLIIVNVYQFGNLGLLSAEGFLRLESIALVLIIYTQSWIFLTKSFARSSMTALILAVACLVSLSLTPWLADHWLILSPFELLTKSRWEDGLWSDNTIVFIQSLGGLSAISLVPTTLAWLLWKRRSLA